jgi:hypothetical protein
MVSLSDYGIWVCGVDHAGLMDIYHCNGYRSDAVPKDTKQE